MSDEQTAPDPLRAAADREVEATAAIARGELVPRATAQESAAAEAEVDEAAGVAPTTQVPSAPGPAAEKTASDAAEALAPSSEPAASVGDADPAAKKVASDAAEATAPSSEPVASVGDADPAAETVREEPPAAPPATLARTDLTADEKTWGTVAHAAAALSFIGVPFGNVVGPLVVWLVKKEHSPWVARHALAALNFQITMSLALVLALLSTFAVIGFVLAPAVVIADIVYTIKATIKAGDCEEPNYPDWSLKLVK